MRMFNVQLPSAYAGRHSVAVRKGRAGPSYTGAVIVMAGGALRLGVFCGEVLPECCGFVGVFFYSGF